MDLPEEDLEELRKVLTSGVVHPLKDIFQYSRQVRQELERFTDRVFMFPIGIQPDLRAPVVVFRNGITQWVGEEVIFMRVSDNPSVVVAVLDRAAPALDVVQASYMTAASEKK